MKFWTVKVADLRERDIPTPQNKTLEHRARQLGANFGTQQSKQNFSKGYLRKSRLKVYILLFKLNVYKTKLIKFLYQTMP